MDQENLRRWRLILGNDGCDRKGKGGLDGTDFELSIEDQRMDNVLGALYGQGSRSGGLGSSSPYVARWLGEIRELFPQSVVQVMQQDAIERFNLTALLSEKEMLEHVTPDVNMVANIMSLSRTIPEKNKEVVREIIRRVVEDLKKKLQSPMEQAVTGALNRGVRRRNPRFRDIDWAITIRKNLQNYQPDYKTIIPEVLIGYGRKGQSLKDIVLCIDQSGSMGRSVIYSGIFGSVLASIPAVSTKVVAFDTAVVDLTEQLQDPVDLLFGVQLGGGTDIAKALTYCKDLVTRPQDTVMVLITDLYEGGDESKMRRVSAELVNNGVNLIVLLALDDDGSPSYCSSVAQFYASIGVPCFACTPDLFPDLMSAALSNKDIHQWASENIHHTDKE